MYEYFYPLHRAIHKPNAKQQMTVYGKRWIGYNNLLAAIIKTTSN